VSCGLHDVIRLESLGVPTAMFATSPFRTEAREQARALAMPDYRVVEVAHPIQPLPDGRVAVLADAVLAEAVTRLTTRPAP
jgi:hypothetical protein